MIYLGRLYFFRLHLGIKSGICMSNYMLVDVIRILKVWTELMGSSDEPIFMAIVKGYV